MIILENLKNIKESKVAKNTIWIIAERILHMFISLIIGIISARFLGPNNYGTLNYGMAVINVFSSITRLGLENIIIKYYVEEKDDNGEILGTALLLRISSSILSIIMISIVISLLKPNDETIIIVTLLQSIALIFQIYELIEFWFQSKLKSKYVSIAKSIAYIVVAIYKISLLVLNKGVEFFAFSTTLDYMLILIIMLIFYKKSNGPKLRCSVSRAQKLVKSSYHFILSGLIVTVYTQMDKLMIGNMLDEKQVGLYSAATSICMMWGFIPEALINSLRPTIYEAKKEADEKNYLIKLKMLYGIIFWLGVFFAISIMIFSDIIINILYGKEYIEAKSALIIAVWYTAFAYLGTARGVWIVCENKNKYVKKYVLYGAIVNVILNYLLIPINGISGAAIATLIAQIIVALIAPIFYKETRNCSKYMIEGIILKDFRQNRKRRSIGGN